MSNRNRFLTQVSYVKALGPNIKELKHTLEFIVINVVTHLVKSTKAHVQKIRKRLRGRNQVLMLKPNKWARNSLVGFT